jgi:hypothetical protein
LHPGKRRAFVLLPKARLVVFLVMPDLKRISPAVAMTLHMQNVPVKVVTVKSQWRGKRVSPETSTPGFTLSWKNGFVSQHTAPLRVIKHVKPGPLPSLAGDTLLYVQSEDGPFELTVGAEGHVCFPGKQSTKNNSLYTLAVRGGSGIPLQPHIPFQIEATPANRHARFTVVVECYCLTQQHCLQALLRPNPFVFASSHLINF